MAKSILSKGQRRLAWGVLGTGGFLVANAAYLWVSPPQESILPEFFQWMLLLHVVVGTLLLVPMAVFVVWHLKRALAMRNPRGNVSGIVVTVAMVALMVTGLFMFTAANSEQNYWAYLSHQICAVIVPFGYVIHRVVAKNPPSRARLAKGVAATVAALGAMLAVHALTLPEPRPPVKHFVDIPKPGEDPWKDGFPSYGVSGARPDSDFSPAATRTVTGRFLPRSFLVNEDWAETEQLLADVKEYGFAMKARLGARTCAKCHPAIVEQWARSAHRYSSFNNPFYRASIDKLRAEPNGRQRSQWCGGCHDPAVMMPGNMLKEIDPTVPESQAGLTCLACHAMDEVHGVGGNGNYRIADRFPDPYLFSKSKSGVFAQINELLVKSKPDVHKRDMLKPFFKTSAYCATCHKVSLDTPVNNYRWLRGQNQHDSLQDSGVSRYNARTFYLPEKARSCQDCHMPRVAVGSDELARDADGTVRSHFFPGSNTALPHIRGDQRSIAETEALLMDCVTVDVFAVRRDKLVFSAPDLRDIPLQAGESVELQIVVRNRKVGHLFPAGTTDSNEAWVHLAVAADDDPSSQFYVSGAIDPKTRVLDPEVHDYRSVFVDENSEEARERNPQDFRAKVHQKLIGPGTADIVRFRFQVPPELAGRRLRVQATLRYRKFNRSYTEFTYRNAMPGRPVPDLPVTDIHRHVVTFPVVDGPAAAPQPLPEGAASKQWTRWNDWGIGLLLQGDTRGAAKAFEQVRNGLIDRPDGWRNLARVALKDGDVNGAVAALQQAETLSPNDAQNAYFFGQARERNGELKEALLAYGRAREAFPNDRTILRAMGNIRYRLERFDEALLDYLAVLAIDPEDRDAHYNRMRIYAALGQGKAASEARKAFNKYKLDESAQKWTQIYRRKHPAVNRESQRIHTHELERIVR